MKVAIIGASGFTGSAITQEALARGHQITALVGNPSRVASAPQIVVRRIDVMDTAALAGAVHDHDAVISAFSGHAQQDVLGYYLRGIRSIVAATKHAEVPRLLVVGGAGSLMVDGKELVDTPSFPPQWKATAEGARRALHLLQEERSLNWTMLSPSAHLVPGKRTGVFRLGADELLVGPNGQSEISLTDYAKAMIDELEKPARPRARFTVGY
jgi:uncharacterized protein